jgi:hypothetical protein
MNHCCDLMEKAVGAEGTRLSFDSVYDEYGLAVLEGYWLDLSHCPFCGAKLPESRSSQYFPAVSEEEQNRVLSLVADCTTRADLSAKLGEPDQCFPKIQDVDRIWGRPISFPSCALYRKLSETAELRISFDDEGTINNKTVTSRCTRT